MLGSPRWTVKTRRKKPKEKSKLARWLREGNVVEWNQARHSYPDWRPDLQHMDLAGCQLAGVNFRDANLRNADLTRCDLTDADLRKALVTFANFNGAILTGANLLGAKNLTRAQLESSIDARGVKYDKTLFGEPRIPGGEPAIFLSYSWRDKPAILAVDQWLRDRGARVILDERNFAAGESIREEILRWIEQAGVVVCFVSANSKDRPYFRLEREVAEFSRGSGKQLIYFNLDDTILDALHQSHLYVPGHRLTFEDACAQLWHGILHTVQPPKPVDLSSVRSAGVHWAREMPEVPPKG